MSCVVFFLPQGQVIGYKKEVSNDGTVFTVENPCLVIQRQNEIMLAPFLQTVEENFIRVNVDDVAFKQFFTPIKDLENHYNQLFGSGIVIADSNALKF